MVHNKFNQVHSCDPKCAGIASLNRLPWRRQLFVCLLALCWLSTYYPKIILEFVVPRAGKDINRIRRFYGIGRQWALAPQMKVAGTQNLRFGVIVKCRQERKLFTHSCVWFAWGVEAETPDVVDDFFNARRMHYMYPEIWPSSRSYEQRGSCP